MVTDLWTETDLPLLVEIAEHDAEHGPIKSQEDLAKLTGEDEQRVRQSLGRLHDGGMIAAISTPMMGASYFNKIRVTAEGRRAVGQWPSRDAAAALLEAIEARITQASDPQERSRWERVRDDLKALGISAVAAVLVESAKYAAGGAP